MITEELRRLSNWGDRHRRLIARLTIVFAITAVIDLVATVGIYFTERHGPQTEITSWGDAFFFTTVQLLTVSSQLKNPVTPGGRGIDIFLEFWAVIVVAGTAGVMAAFVSED